MMSSCNTFPLEAAERVFQRLAFLELYLSQMAPPMLTLIPIPCSHQMR